MLFVTLPTTQFRFPQGMMTSQSPMRFFSTDTII
jgi:hypothetical protein